ncbi:MAG TPA: NHLP family bacteriocin export ABC transporter peptidase/permease/ATPase subunit [Gemmatimonadaceae bacterium]|nr:NHLP family bacteriocin export ABC transporter peptidase/permease/ATPase subunit [Gemmatimonadaceae bacterium]
MLARSRKRVRTPTVLQMEAVECGAAALAMVLAHHGRMVPLEELRLACGVSRDGSKASSMLRAARHYGLVAKGFRREPADLRALPLPIVVHWNFNHFLVVEGFGRERVYLNDPATGPRHVPHEEFDQAFTGVVLTFERGDGFERGGERPSMIAALRRRVSGSGVALAYMVLAGFALLVPGMITPTFSRIFVDSILVRGLTQWMTPLLWVMGAATSVTILLVWLQQRYLLRFETKLALDSSAKFFWHVLRLPVEFFAQRYAGEIGNRVELNDRIARLLSGELATTALGVMVIAFYAVLMVQYDIVLAAIAVVTALLNMAALRYVSRLRTDLNQRLLQDRGKAMGTAMGGLQTIETLKATGAESDFFARWSGQQAKVVNAQQRLQLATELLGAVPPLLLTLDAALILGVGGVRVMDGHLSMGMLVAFQSLALLFLSPVNRLVTLGGTLQEVRGDMARLDDVLRARTDPGAAPTDESSITDDVPPKLSGALELRGVSFGYSRLEPPLIESFDLVLRPGSRVALVGGSGCGKSTVAKLVSGLYEPWSGEVLFDGLPRAIIPRSVLTNSLGVVDQEIFMFEGSVRDNISLWDATISEAGLARAGRDACIHEEVTARAGGYASHVAESGGNFSGGQRQRLEIARALAADPAILVLDEATSALDPATEKAIDDGIRQRGCTCLIVAHRLSTIRDCDEIIVLDRGKIVERGTHDALCAANGRYRELIAAE